MRIEHMAINVADPVGMAQWYGRNLGTKVVREGPGPINARFMADASSNVILEVYNNPPDAVPDYANMDPLLLHIAFIVDNVKEACEKLIAAGGTAEGGIDVLDNGDEMTMVRDPWGIAIQLLKRAEPMLS